MKKESPSSFYYRFIKRPIDLIVSIVLLVMLSPLLVAIALLVLKNYGKPILYRARRPGKNEKLFTMYKFRSMSNEKDSEGHLLMDNLRLTPFGRFLRAASLDELPGLFNILKGNMSFVGPRPLAPQYLPYYSEEENRRHCILPGITGLAQVNGRNALSWEEKFQYDIQYVDTLSFKLDVMIMIKTISVVTRHSDIGVRGEDSPEGFHKYRARQLLKEKELY
ncbi:MAG: sugar transferase [Candidatus Marinimicrobia bacterium]|nr:sugar transferase [Candidatus Neomarinimicrobiota bacterium]